MSYLFSTDYLKVNYMEQNMNFIRPLELDMNKREHNKQGSDNHDNGSNNENDSQIRNNLDDDNRGTYEEHSNRDNDDNRDNHSGNRDGKSAAKCKKICNVIHYVPIIDTLKNYLTKEEVWANCNLSSNSDGILRDYSDGSAYQSQFFANNFICLHLYSDELEICSALGSRKGTHKLSVFYFIVGNIDSKYWTSLKHIHLAVITKYNVVKKFG